MSIDSIARQIATIDREINTVEKSIYTIDGNISRKSKEALNINVSVPPHNGRIIRTEKKSNETLTACMWWQ